MLKQRYLATALILICWASCCFASFQDKTVDVLVYGSTPSGVLAAVASSRHGASTALLSQRKHLGGVVSGGLGQTDIGSCAEQVIGGFTREFFLENAKQYATPQPRSPWNVEPHVARRVFMKMLRQANVTLFPYGEVESVVKDSTDGKIQYIVMEKTKVKYSAKIFIDASYEGDLMARTPGVEYTYGRESRDQYNESGAGSQGMTRMQHHTLYMNPFDENGNLLPYLLRQEQPGPVGQGDKQIQAYNFRLCVTNDSSLIVPFTKPHDYRSQDWELLSRFWMGWRKSNSTDNPYRDAQARVPTAILGEIPSTSGAKKFDANNCGYNPVHTDMIGGSWEYPEANYTYRQTIWNAHVSYTKGFLWFMSSDPSVPRSIQNQFATRWGYCGDEFHDTNHFPPQLYIREARRLVGDRVFTQNDVLSKIPRGNESIGMGCYGFDSHCEERYACIDPAVCAIYDTPYVNLQCGCGGIGDPGIYQMPTWLLFPKRLQVSNLLVPVCSSASHVAYATIRMEPQFMILGHAAGVIAALSVTMGLDAVQNVEKNALAAQLLADGQFLWLNDEDSVSTVQF